MSLAKTMVACCAAMLVACVSNAAADYDPVPDDEIKPLAFEVVDPLTLAELTQEFERDHQASELILNDYGDGSCSWGTGYGDLATPPVYHPLVRDTARRVLGYIDAYVVTGTAIYEQRAKEGLEYLLDEQQPDGQFIWWYGDPVNGTTGGGSSLYVTGIPTAAFMKGYKVFGDARYLAAANAACDYICTVGYSSNANYDLFAAWALAANYDVTQNAAYLDRAIGHALHAIGSDDGTGYQLPSGMWYDDHNKWIWYHGIILRGLATLLSVMPEDNPDHLQIQQATYKAMNHMRDRQRADGGVLEYPTDTTTSWRVTLPSHGIGTVVRLLNWPVTDSIQLISKGFPHYESNPEGLQGLRGDYAMAIGDAMLAYTDAGIEREPVGRYVFYNRSSFDGNNAAANANDDDAIATNKTALLPGVTATFSNYTSYSLGINGIMVDIPSMPGTPTAADFIFKVSNNNNPPSWSAAPSPSGVTVRPGAGAGGSDRITIIWADNVIQKQWLQVTVRATDATGLAADDVFYFGNAIGETGNSAVDAKVTPTDQIGVRNNPHTLEHDPADIEDAYDFNRDRKVGPTDEILVRNNGTSSTTALKLITVP